MINIAVADRLEELEKQGKLTPEMRELASFAFEMGSKVEREKIKSREDDGVEAIDQEDSYKDYSSPFSYKVAQAKSNSNSTSVGLDLDTVEFYLGVKKLGFPDKQYHIRELVSIRMLGSNPSHIVDIIMEKMRRTVAADLTDDVVRRELL